VGRHPARADLLMLFRPQGLFGFRELKLNLGGEPAEDEADAPS